MVMGKNLHIGCSIGRESHTRWEHSMCVLGYVEEKVRQTH